MEAKGKQNMITAEEIQAFFNQNSEAVQKAYGYESSLREYADSVLKRELSFDRAAYMLEKEYPHIGCDKWFVRNDLRSIINHMVPIRKES
jgi:hypothetical protein